MNKVSSLFPDALDMSDDEYTYFSPPGYDTLIRSFGYTVLANEDDGSYQGDSFYLLSDSGYYGVLIFGWGSCSGCDSLEACRHFEDLQELYDELLNGIVWFADTASLMAWLDTRGDANTWYYHDDGWAKFVNEVTKKLAEVI